MIVKGKNFAAVVAFSCRVPNNKLPRAVKSKAFKGLLTTFVRAEAIGLLPTISGTANLASYCVKLGVGVFAAIRVLIVSCGIATFAISSLASS